MSHLHTTTSPAALLLSDESPGAETEPRMTTTQIVRFLNDNGFPLSEAYFRKITLPSQDSGPPFTWWGGKKLYSPSLTLQWAKERCGGSKRGTLAVA